MLNNAFNAKTCKHEGTSTSTQFKYNCAKKTQNMHITHIMRKESFNLDKVILEGGSETFGHEPKRTFIQRQPPNAKHLKTTCTPETGPNSAKHAELWPRPLVCLKEGWTCDTWKTPPSTSDFLHGARHYTRDIFYRAKPS